MGALAAHESGWPAAEEGRVWVPFGVCGRPKYNQQARSQAYPASGVWASAANLRVQSQSIARADVGFLGPLVLARHGLHNRVDQGIAVITIGHHYETLAGMRIPDQTAAISIVAP